MNKKRNRYILAFDTANEVVAIGIGIADAASRAIAILATAEIAAHRASNTQLLPRIDELLTKYGVDKAEIGCVACGLGPGSFTGVRICMATAKGMASALGVGLFGVSTLDAVAWNMHDAGIRGHVAVVADAMRKEVYPVEYALDDTGIRRLQADSVKKAEGAAAEVRADLLAGDALIKHADIFVQSGPFADEGLWCPTGKGLLLAVQAAWQTDAVDLFGEDSGDPALVLPVYTRLSDAEENERIRFSKNDPKNLKTGVQEAGIRRDRRAQTRDTAFLNAGADEKGMVYRPLDAAHVDEVVRCEASVMGTDAWDAARFFDDLPRKDRIWWAAYSTGGETNDASASHGSHEDFHAERLVGYIGGWVVDGQAHILKIAVHPDFRRQGIAHALLIRLIRDARDLGAHEYLLEVRASNDAAHAFYEKQGFTVIGVRKRYYSDGEDALVMKASLPAAIEHVAGMEVQVRDDSWQGNAPDAPKDAPDIARPLILAIETSCDETAAALVEGRGNLIVDVVASQIDFHARFGGVVPEIASRKHIEAICGVVDECLSVAGRRLGVPDFGWADLTAIAVTYAPGLVGALVVGVAFSKAAAWALDIPCIGVNHLEGHIYANKLSTPDIAPPLVVSLVSGGHTMLVHVKDWGDYEVLGATLDDAVGEAFDKVAKAMGLGYPGGPAISRLAKEGNPAAIDFPRAMMHSGDLRFSLSGLKTAVVTYIKKQEEGGEPLNKADVAASFQQAVIDVQIAKARKALEQTGAKEFCLGGGVAANEALREAYEALCARMQVRLSLPPLHACTDNAAMIALVALDRYAAGAFLTLDADAYAVADLAEPY